ncbi:MAG: aldo/keto reductase [Actinobacteria bacterium]|nr:MAG: aldo/keto reductase [Actinomycetota bacterium]
MRLCGEDIWGEPDDPENARAVLRRAVELGVQLIDTADAYGPEVNERQIADALHPYPDDVVIATKGSGTRPSRKQWEVDGRPEHLREACEASLRRLRLERIDLYQLHGPDDNVPIEESVGALADLQREGKIRHIGVSNVDEDELARAQSVARIVSVQNEYNVADRTSESVVRTCERDGLVFLPYFPIGAGWRAATPTGAVDRVAEKHGVTRQQVALAWLLHHSPATLPIPGTSSLEHLEENVAAASLTLDDDDLAALG